MPEAAGAGGRYVFFRVGAELYAVPTTEVETVIQEPSPIPLPAMPPHLSGVMAYRDAWLPVVDARALLDGSKADEHDTRAAPGAVLLLRRGSIRYALAVDAVEAARDVRPEGDAEHENGEPSLAAFGAARVVRFDGDVATILDVDALFDATPPTEPVNVMERTDRRQEPRRRMLALRAGALDLALDVGGVEEVLPYRRPEPIADAPPWVLGAIESREALVPVLDLRRLLGEPDPAPGDGARFVLLDAGGAHVALLVDGVSDVVEVPESGVRATPPFVSGLAPEFVAGVAEDGDALRVVLRPERLLDADAAATLAGLTLEPAGEAER